ncbi:MAG TPA: hydroxyisourate hydrolase [Acidobacteriaceae bacterium]|nr:hydroxyisourate hydrolase [Acidobacteriaceae bacterium]
MGLSTHILDTALGKPAAGVALVLYRQAGERWDEIGRGSTDNDGRCRTLLGETSLTHAQYRLRFEIAPYFNGQGIASLYPYVEIVFAVEDPEQHFHIPLLVAANGYTTYRGS